MLSKLTVVSVVGEQVSVDLAEEIVILNYKTGNYFGLEGVGTRIWSLIQNPIAIEKPVETIANECEVDAGGCEHDLLGLLEELVSEGLVEVRDNATC